MGKIDEALRRSNVDAAQGTGAETPSPAASPWRVEEREVRGAPEAGRASEAGPAAGAPAGRLERGERGRHARPGGFDSGAIERLVVSKTAAPLLVEQFRVLAATLLRARSERQLKSVIVTSPSPGDGKSHVAVNLAMTLSGSYRRRVLLVDADLRRPTLHLLFGIPNAGGLSQALKESTGENVATVRISDTLAVVPAGRPEPNPLSGLSSGRMKRLVEDAASQFDWVIVDSPPVGLLADAHLVSETVDGAIIVVRAGVTRFPDLAAAADTLGHDRIVGIVLNSVDPAEIRGKAYYSHYYGGERGKS